MDGFTSAHKEQANCLLRAGHQAYLGKIAITIKTVTDVLSPANKQIFISLEAQNNVSHTNPQLVPSEANDIFTFNKTLKFLAVFARADNVTLLEGSIKNGTPLSNFIKCPATFTTREQGNEARVRDFGIVDLTNFLFAHHSTTETSVDMKLGGSLEIVVECWLESWKNRGIEITASKIDKSSRKRVDEEEGKHKFAPIWSKGYKQLYETYNDRGEWSEYAEVKLLEYPRKMEFWKIEGPEESDSESDSELEKVCEEQYRVNRRRVVEDCRVGKLAKTGKMSCLQKYRVTALETVKPRGALRTLDSAYRCEIGRGIVCEDVLYVEENGLNESQDGDEGIVVKRRISDCSDEEDGIDEDEVECYIR